MASLCRSQVSSLFLFPHLPGCEEPLPHPPATMDCHVFLDMIDRNHEPKEYILPPCRCVCHLYVRETTKVTNVCNIIHYINVCVCVCKCVLEIKPRVLSHYTMALPQNYMNFKLILFVCGSLNVCVWTRGQKRVSGVLLCLSLAIL